MRAIARGERIYSGAVGLSFPAGSRVRYLKQTKTLPHRQRLEEIIKQNGV